MLKVKWTFPTSDNCPPTLTNTYKFDAAPSGNPQHFISLLEIQIEVWQSPNLATDTIGWENMPPKLLPYTVKLNPLSVTPFVEAIE